MTIGPVLGEFQDLTDWLVHKLLATARKVTSIVKTGFVPISLEEHVELHLKDDSDTIREEITAALRDALGAHKRGAKCYNCGNHVWVIGSAFTHNLRFTCITGEAIPEDDYEIDDACY